MYQVRYLIVVAVALVLGCGNDKGSAEKKQPDKPKAYSVDEVTKAANRAFIQELEERGEQTPGSHQWKPAEYKSGRGRWRDAGIYVDGVPVGVLWFGELPATQKPVFVEQLEGLDFRAGDTGPRERIVKVRRYRFSDYFEGVGVDLKKIKEIHFYGPNKGILVVSGELFLEVKDYFYFRFGLGTQGKPIAVIPKQIGSNFDRMMGVAIYIDKKPPTLDDDGVPHLDGEPIFDVPYYGTPLRGGIRVYKDDRLATTFKRNELAESEEAEEDGTEFKLVETLKAQGVKVDDIILLEVIFDERRHVRFDKDALKDMTMKSSSQARGTILLNGETPAHALAFYTTPQPERAKISEAGGDE